MPPLAVLLFTNKDLRYTRPRREVFRAKKRTALDTPDACLNG